MAWTPFYISAVGQVAVGCNNPLSGFPNYVHLAPQTPCLNFAFPLDVGKNFPGKYLAVWSITYSSKNIHYNPEIVQNGPNQGNVGIGLGPSKVHENSYLVLNDLPTVTEAQPHIVFPQPIVFGPYTAAGEFILDGGFCNNACEPVDMIAVICGRIGDTWQEAAGAVIATVSGGAA